MEFSNPNNLKKVCEKIHLNAINNLELNPEIFEFDNQIKELEKLDGGLSREDKVFYQSFANWSPSRYEIVKLIPTYHCAVKHIQIAQDMSKDRNPLTPLNFTILTNPIRSLNARARDKIVDNTCLILFDLGLFRYCEYIARALMKSIGSLEALANIGTDEKKMSAIELFDSLSSFLDLPTDNTGHTLFTTNAFRSKSNLDFIPKSKSHFGFGVLMQMLVTFIAGHEAGHFQLGHVGSENNHRNKALRTYLTQKSVNPKYFIEFEADLIGFLVLIDGMSKDEFFKTSVDFTAISPFIYFAAMAGYYHYIIKDPISTEFWQQRQFVLLEALINDMFREGYEVERIGNLVISIPALSAAITCWIGVTVNPNVREHVLIVQKATFEIAKMAFDTNILK